MQAVILAGGVGGRCRPYTANRPKCLLELGRVTVLDLLLDTLSKGGVREIIVVKHDGMPWDQIAAPNVTYCIDRDRNNMVHSLFCADELICDEVIVSYADIVFEPQVLAAVVDSPADIAVAVDTGWAEYFGARFGNPYAQGECLRVDGDRIIEIGRPNPAPEDAHAQYIGLIKFSRAGFVRTRELYWRARAEFWGRPWQRAKEFRFAFMTDLLQALISAGESVTAVPIHHGWLEFDTATDYEITLGWLRDGSLSRYFRHPLLPAGGR